MTAALVVAAGSGSRIGGTPKQFRDLGGVPLLAWSCAALRRHPCVGFLAVAVPPGLEVAPPDWLADLADRVVGGGETRRESTGRGLAALPPGTGQVLVHDGARPFLSATLVDRLLDGSDVPSGGVIPGVPPADTIRIVDRAGHVVTTPVRSTVRCIQTPQAFPAGLLARLHAEAEAEGRDVPDDASLWEDAGYPVRVVQGDPWNLKVTTTADLAFARWWVGSGAAAEAGFEAPSVPGIG